MVGGIKRARLMGSSSCNVQTFGFHPEEQGTWPTGTFYPRRNYWPPLTESPDMKYTCCLVFSKLMMDSEWAIMCPYLWCALEKELTRVRNALGWKQNSLCRGWNTELESMNTTNSTAELTSTHARGFKEDKSTYNFLSASQVSSINTFWVFYLVADLQEMYT